MALSVTDLDLLKRIYGRCDPIESLRPDDPRYVPIYQGGHCEDPVSRLKAHIGIPPKNKGEGLRLPQSSFSCSKTMPTAML